MKKLIVILALLASNAYASNWIKVATSTEGTVASIDTNSINQGVASDYRYAWVKYSTNVKSELIRYELYCPTKLARRMQHAEYIKDVLTNSYVGQQIWNSAIPDTIEMSAVQVACLLGVK